MSRPDHLRKPHIREAATDNGRRFFVPGPADGGETPRRCANALLQSSLTSVEPLLSARLYRYSYLDFYTRFATDPTAYGFPAVVNCASNCRADRPVVAGKIDCTNCFRFDGTHFTAQVQRGIARDIVRVLGVPEPANWAMLITGFGLVGAMMRRRAALA